MDQTDPAIKISDPSRDLWDKFQKQFGWLFVLVVGAMLIGFITMLFMVAQLIVEAARFNSTYHREFQQLQQQEANILNTVEQQKEIIRLLQEMRKGSQGNQTVNSWNSKTTNSGHWRR